MSDVSKTSELIAKLHNLANLEEFVDDALAELLSDAADALEAAARVPVQGEPNDDRENLITERTYGHGSITLTHYRSSGRIGVVQRGENSVMDVTDLLVFLQDSGLDEDFSRATVPDAATERELEAVKEHREKWMARAFRAEAERDAATEELRADKMTAEEAIELVLKRPGMYGLVPKNEHRSMKAERDAALADLQKCGERWDRNRVKFEQMRSERTAARRERDAAQRVGDAALARVEELEAGGRVSQHGVQGVAQEER